MHINEIHPLFNNLYLPYVYVYTWRGCNRTLIWLKIICFSAWKTGQCLLISKFLVINCFSITAFKDVSVQFSEGVEGAFFPVVNQHSRKCQSCWSNLYQLSTFSNIWGLSILLLLGTFFFLKKISYISYTRTERLEALLWGNYSLVIRNLVTWFLPLFKRSLRSSKSRNTLHLQRTLYIFKRVVCKPAYQTENINWTDDLEVT